MQGRRHRGAHHLGSHLPHGLQVQAPLPHRLRHQARAGGPPDADLPRLHPPAVRAGEAQRLDEGRGRQGAVRHRLRQEEQLHPGRRQCGGDHRLEEGIRIFQHRQDHVSWPPPSIHTEEINFKAFLFLPCNTDVKNMLTKIAKAV